MGADYLGIALGAPGPPTVVEVADQLLSLRVDRNDRLATAVMSTDLLVQVTELCVAIGVLTALHALAVGLQAVVEVLGHHVGHRAARGRVPRRAERISDLTG